MMRRSKAPSVSETTTPVRNNPRRKSLFKRMLLLVATLLDCVVVVEIGLRLHAKFVADHTTITSDQLLGWKLLPGARRTIQGVGGPYYAIDGHFTPFGHKLMAEELSRHLHNHPALRKH